MLFLVLIHWLIVSIGVRRGLTIVGIVSMGPLMRVSLLMGVDIVLCRSKVGHFDWWQYTVVASDISMFSETCECECGADLVVMRKRNGVIY